MDALRVFTFIVALGGVSACGDTLGQQALIGAGAGAGTAAVADGDIVTGAALGLAANVTYCQLYPERC